MPPTPRPKGMPFLRLRMASTQNINTATLTALSFDTLSDRYRWPSLTLPTDSITVPYAGVLMIVAHDADINDSGVALATGARRITLERNGDNTTRRAFMQIPGAGGAANLQSVLSGVAVEAFSAGGSVKIFVNQTSGSTLAVALNDLFLVYLSLGGRTFA